MKLTSLGNLIIPIAQGPQYHADELDSAWDTIKNLVPPRLERALAKQITGETPAQAMANPRRRRSRSRYRNPEEEEEEGQEEAPAASTGMAGLTGKEKSDTTIESGKLALPAMLVTGQWGKPELAEEGKWKTRSLNTLAQRSFDSGYRGPLPNPDDGSLLTNDEDTFFVRMEKLEKVLTDLINQALYRYARKTKKDPRTKEVIPAPVEDPKKMGWVIALSNCRQDVRWVRQQKDLAYAGDATVVQKTVANRTQRAKRAPRAKKVKEINTVMGLTKLWSIISAKGNNKLPFAAYSTLPMASCPGAGTCGVPVFDGKFQVSESQGYCYSIKAWRYPDAFARQFRNQLAETADREFAIMAGAAAAGLNPDTLTYEQRVAMALSPKGRESRSWHQLVALQTIAALKSKLMLGKSCFLRIYVDGDINTEDNIVEWMQMCLNIGQQGKLMEGFVVDGIQQHIECYGYSKCWHQFVEANRIAIRDRWPLNYTVNMSKDSIYERNETVKEAMKALSITRGYFESIPIKRAVVDLVGSYDVSTGTVKPFPMPDPAKTPFPFDLSRINQIVEINARMAGAESKGLREATKTAQELADKIGFKWTADPEPQQDEKKAIEQLRSSLYRAYFAYLLTDGRGFYGIVEAELAKDDNVVFEKTGLPDIDTWRKKTERAKEKAAEKLATKKGISKADVQAFVNEKVAKYRGTMVTSKRWQDKALALSLHEAIWATTEKGGSCPLVCGNCFDIVAGDTTVKPVHRCASKDAFKGRTIYIGRH